MILRKVMFIETCSLIGTPLSQRAAEVRATMSFFFPKSKKLVVAVMPWYILSTRWLCDLHSNCLVYNLLGGRWPRHGHLRCFLWKKMRVSASRAKNNEFSWYGCIFSKNKFASALFELPQILTNHADSIKPNRHSSCHWPQWSHWRAFFSWLLWEISEYYW